MKCKKITCITLICNILMFRVILCMSPLEKVPFATFYPRWKYLCGTYFSKKDFFKWIHVFNFIDWCNLFSQHYLRALSAKNANHLQTTDTIKRHQRYSIHYHCGWPSLGIWGSATHYGLPALPEPFLRACGLHNPDVQGNSMYSILSVDATYFFNITIDKLIIYML